MVKSGVTNEKIELIKDLNSTEPRIVSNEPEKVVSHFCKRSWNGSRFGDNWALVSSLNLVGDLRLRVHRLLPHTIIQGSKLGLATPVSQSIWPCRRNIISL
jgi:hypothetical protein